MMESYYTVVLSAILHLSQTLHIHVQTKESDWLGAERSCMKLRGRLAEDKDLTDVNFKELNSYFWVDGAKQFTPFIYYDGCYNISFREMNYPMMVMKGYVARCAEICQTSQFALKNYKEAVASCICLPRHFDLSLQRTNISFCDTSCSGDVRDRLGGHSVVSVYRAGDKLPYMTKTNISFINKTQCLAVQLENVDYHTETFDCNTKQNGYICQFCSETCVEHIYNDSVTWYEAHQSCTAEGGFLGIQFTSSNDSLSQNTFYWTGYRRWMVDIRPFDGNVSSSICRACRFQNGTKECVYRVCDEKLRTVCVTYTAPETGDKNRTDLTTGTSVTDFIQYTTQRPVTRENFTLQEKLMTWAAAKSSCVKALADFLTKDQFSKDIFIKGGMSSFYWIQGTASYTTFIGYEGCFLGLKTKLSKSIHRKAGVHPECMRICSGYTFFAFQQQSTTFESCYCLKQEDIKMLQRGNESDCNYTCAEDNGFCGGPNAVSVYSFYENVIVLEKTSVVSEDCLYVVKSTDSRFIDSQSCLQPSEGYLCEFCEGDLMKCTTRAYIDVLTWHDAETACRNRSGRLGKDIMGIHSIYSFPAAGRYWSGYRRWLKEMSNVENSQVEACLACRIQDGKEQCEYRMCNEQLPSLCFSDNDENSTIDIFTYMPNNKKSTKLVISYIQSTLKSTGNADITSGDDETSANVIAVVVALVLISGIIVLLMVTKLKKSEKITSDVTDLIDTSNGPIKFTVLTERSYHGELERQRSFSNPAFMEQDINILKEEFDVDTSLNVSTGEAYVSQHDPISSVVTSVNVSTEKSILPELVSNSDVETHVVIEQDLEKSRLTEKNVSDSPLNFSEETDKNLT